MTISVDRAALRELNIRLTEIDVSENDSTEQECRVALIRITLIEHHVRETGMLITTSSGDTRFSSKVLKHCTSNVYRCDKNRETDFVFRTELQNGTDTMHNNMLRVIESTETNDRS